MAGPQLVCAYQESFVKQFRFPVQQLYGIGPGILDDGLKFKAETNQ